MLEFHWNSNRNSNIFIQETTLENVACEMTLFCLGLNVLRESCEATRYIVPVRVICRSNHEHYEACQMEY